MEAQTGQGSFGEGNFEARLGYKADHKACLVAQGSPGLAIVQPEHNWWAPTGDPVNIDLTRIQTAC